MLYEGFPSDFDNLSSFYAGEGYGALCCDEAYLEKTFGKIEVIKGDIYEKPGVIITDYLADSIIKNNIYTSSYDDIVGKYSYNPNTYETYSYIKAIIKTDYKNELKEYIDYCETHNGKLHDGNHIRNNDFFENFVRIIQTKYGLAYTFSSDFLEDNISKDSLGWLPLRFTTPIKDGVEFNCVGSISVTTSALPLNKGEAIFNLRYYNSIFGENYTVDNMDTFEPVTITLKKHYDYTKETTSEVYGTATIKIVSLYDSVTTHDMFIRADDYSIFKDVSTINYGLLLDDVKSSVKCLETISSDYYILDAMADNVAVLSRYIYIFNKVSLLVSFILGALAVIYLSFYEISNIKINKREIGILKACGTKQRTVSVIFILQQALLSVMVVVLSLLLSYVLIKFSNYLLVTSVERYAKVYVGDIVLIRFRPLNIIVSLCATISVIMVSCAIPILLLTRIKPMTIIKSEE